MSAIEICTIVVAAAIVLGYFGIEIYRKITGKPSINDDCASTHKGKALIKAYRKQKEKERKTLEKEAKKKNEEGATK